MQCEKINNTLLLQSIATQHTYFPMGHNIHRIIFHLCFTLQSASQKQSSI